MKWKRVLFRKVDLDTLVAAYIANCSEENDIKKVYMASDEELLDSTILCLEVGGSGQVIYNNFDHHDPLIPYPPASFQAWLKFREIFWKEELSTKVNYLYRLVLFTTCIDEAIPLQLKNPTLSSLISGLVLVEKNEELAFRKGIRLIEAMVNCNLDPFGELDIIKLSRVSKLPINEYLSAKEENIKKLLSDLAKVNFYWSVKKKLRVAILITEAIGGLKYLTEQGADIAVVFCPSVKKYTIASHKVSLITLLQRLKEIEPGWGGRSSIIGSPFEGSILTPDKLINIIITTY